MISEKELENDSLAEELLKQKVQNSSFSIMISEAQPIKVWADSNIK